MLLKVVCLDGWQNLVWSYAKQFGITKLSWITTGGKSSQESIRNGIFHLKDKANKDDIIIVHDGIRPLVEDFVLTDVINICQNVR
ncbi:MAG: 2-C-methyl-D-erythritol 4-phosphate cytidylyltransferase [Sphaerochaetaceae bacterium]